MQTRAGDISLLFPGFTFRDNSRPLTFLAVNLKVCRGGVVVHVMLVDLFVEALSLLYPEVLCRSVVQRSL